MHYVFHRIHGSLMTSKNLSPGQSKLASGYRQARRTQDNPLSIIIKVRVLKSHYFKQLQQLNCIFSSLNIQDASFSLE